ncbi:carbohydrate ABC transporter permease [Diaminobutyricibacter sp. McL0608]|uniref:carbohydrate ABC transporter permease n=1 Tax=Leifsonia sp. McL0608 TaxID=3143537 RepID=UPI0031F2FB0B
MVWLSSRWRIALMVAPAIIVFTGLIVYPVIYSAGYSLTDFAGFGDPVFVGLKNYIDLWNDPFFWSSLRNTLIILVVSIVVLVPSSFGLALLLRRRFPGGGALRALVFAPAIIAPILIGLIWVFILDPKIGMLNHFLGWLGLPQPEWIGGNVLTPYSVALVFIWSSVGFAMTIFYAGLQQLPGDVIEASSLDGASGWKQLLYVTVPLMKESFAIASVLLITNVFKIFELVYVLTNGGPVHRSETLVSYMYFITFTNQQYGSGMALAVIITVLGAVVSLAYLLVLRGRKSE